MIRSRRIPAVALTLVALVASLALPAPALAAEPGAPAVADDAYALSVGGSLDVLAPGVLGNDEPLPDGLHLHKQTTLASSSGYVNWSIADDGSVHLEVPATTSPGVYELAYCMGATSDEGSACTSETATVTVTVTAPTTAGDAYTVALGGTLDVPAPGVLANDSPLPSGLHLHKQTTLDSASGAVSWSIADDGSIHLEVPATTTPETYELSYCMGLSTSEGSACTSNASSILITVPAPTTAADAYTVTAGGFLEVPAPGVLANDSALPSGLHLHKQTTLASSGGSVNWSIADDGSIRVDVPDTTMPETYDLAYCMGLSTTEGSPCVSNQSTIRITVVGPHAVDDVYSAPADDLLIVGAPGVLGNDQPGSLSVGARNPSTPSHGDLVLTPDGAFEYEPDAGFTGADSFTYEMYDLGTGDLVDTATVTLTVDVVPAANPDVYQTTPGSTLNVSAPGVLANDSLPGGGSAAVVEDPAHGTLVLDPDGGFSYTPAPGFTGTDTFRYTLVGIPTRASLVGEVSIRVVAPSLDGSTRALAGTGSTIDPGATRLGLLTLLLGLGLTLLSRRRSARGY